MDTQQLAKDNLIFMCLAGSHAYGMATPESDKDYRGLFVGMPRNVMTPFFPIDQVTGVDGEKDSVVYEINKFMKLLTEQNPNILELLWVDEKFIGYNSIWYKELREHRKELLSSKCRHTFSGYAFSQLKRIRGHNKWINNPQPKRRPKEIDFVSVVYNFTNNKLWNKTVPTEGFKAYGLGNDMYALKQVSGKIFDLLFKTNLPPINWIDIHEAIKEVESHSLTTLKPDLIVKFSRQMYKEHVENWKSYWDWKKNRNEKRSELEKQHGYDTKHASHLIRLLRMGKEILETGEVLVLRPDTDDLKAIRNGKYTYDEIVEMAETMEAELEIAYKATALPWNVDMEFASQLLTDVYMDYWGLHV